MDTTLRVLVTAMLGLLAILAWSRVAVSPPAHRLQALIPASVVSAAFVLWAGSALVHTL